MDRFTVTNREFERFVDATGYVTLAEKPADPADYPGATPEMLAPSSTMFRKPAGPVDLRQSLQLVGLCARAPTGVIRAGRRARSRS